MSYVHLKSIIVISNNVLHINFWAISFNRTQHLHFPKNSRKFMTIAPPSKLCSQKLHQSSYKTSILQAKLCTIPCIRIRGRTTTRVLGKTEQRLSPLSYIYQNSITIISNYTHFACKFFCNFIHQKLRSGYPKNFEKNETTTPVELFFTKS